MDFAGLVLILVLTQSFLLPQPIKSQRGGGEGNRTPVLITIRVSVYMHILIFEFRSWGFDRRNPFPPIIL